MIKSFFCTAVFVLAACFQVHAQTVTYVRGHTVPNSRGDAVADGDTLRVQPDDGANGEELRIRMIGMDTPELHLPVAGQSPVGQAPWGQQASDALEAMVPAYTEVIVEVHGLDRYRRTLGRIYLASDWTDVNYAMVRSGWATPYIYCSGVTCAPGYLERENVQSYLEACDAARSEGLGVFNPNSFMDEQPFEFRLRMQNRTPDKHVGDFGSRKLYQPTEYSQVDVCRRIFFDTESHAEALGFSSY